MKLFQETLSLKPKIVETFVLRPAFDDTGGRSQAPPSLVRI